MAHSTDPEDNTVLSPDEAFSLLGNDTRIRILRVLGEAETPLSFTELRDRVGIRQGQQFNYHLDKLVGHFIRKNDTGYVLRQAGRRVIEAVLSGIVTEDPRFERTEVEKWPCQYCGAPTEVRYRQERVERYCTECVGLFGEGSTRKVPDMPREEGDLGYLDLPPAGIQDRTAQEIWEAAITWTYSEMLVTGNGVCPRCSAPVTHDVVLCEDHDTEGGLCDKCGRRQQVSFQADCLNCIFKWRSVLSVYVASRIELLDFMTDRGLDPLADSWDWGWDYEEEILSTSPFRGRFTFTIDGDPITLTLNDDLEVVEVTQ